VSVLVILTGASQVLLFRTGVGQTALVDQWERTALALGQRVDDARYAQFQALSRLGPLYGLATALASGPVLTLVVAGAIFGVFRPRPPETVSFSQVTAVVAHASLVLAIRQILTAPVSYVRESTGSASSLALWFPSLDAGSPAAGVVGALDIFVMWWLVLVAIGVAVLYRRRARAIAAAFLGIYAGLALLVAVTVTALGGIA
jgi:hypothetical protein